MGTRRGILVGHQEVDLTIVGAYQFLHDRQADAAAARCVWWLALAADKGFEHAGTVGGRDAGTFIDDIDARPPRPLRHREDDASADRAEPDRVRQQVAQGGAQLLGIDFRLNGPAGHGDLQLARLPLQFLRLDLLSDPAPTSTTETREAVA